MGKVVHNLLLSSEKNRALPIVPDSPVFSVNRQRFLHTELNQKVGGGGGVWGVGEGVGVG